ncbi:ras guanine nucleotide exchange factor domain-containing protein [Kalaharituber pfeilii]|nr:ras guanine nucleotide exchange factor domain-containing protein [Kalaharituber pfeilii]
MITAAGAGASFCTVTPARLRPKSPKSPRGLQPQQHPPLPALPTQTSQQQAAEPASPPFLHNLLQHRTNSAPTSPNSVISGINTLVPDEWDSTASETLEGDSSFYRSSQSPTSSEFLEPPSPKSFYSVATSSSGGTARGVQPPVFDELPQFTEQYPSQYLTGAPLAMWSNHPSDSVPFSSSPETMGLYGIDGDQSPRRSSRKKSSSRDCNITSTGHGREICIAVIGKTDVGKSTFIQKAYDLKALPKQNTISSKGYHVDKLLCDVKLVEIDSDRMDLDSQSLVWPRLPDGQRLPFIDGALILYDITNSASLERVPELLDAFAKASLPYLLVASKCDASPNRRQIDPAAIEQHLGPFGGVEAMQTSANSTSQKKCMAQILNIIIARRNEKSPWYLNGRRRANSTATNNSRGTSPRPSTSRSGHSRASSEFSAILLKDYPQVAQSHGTTVQGRLSRSPIASNLGANQTSQLSIPVGSAATPHLTLTTPSPMLEISPFTRQSGRLHNSSLTVSKPRDSFLDMEDDSSIKDLDDVPILEREGSMLDEEYNTVPDEEQKPVRAVGYTWDELVDRLLQEKMTKADSNFVTVFLCFYRKISPPKELLRSILERFERANQDKILLARINTQLRYCLILNQWVADHPGDFAHPKTRQKFTSFLNSISSNRTFAFLAREMQQNLLNTIEDEDASWGKADGDVEGDPEARKSTLLSICTTHESSKSGSTEAQSSRHNERANLLIPRNDMERRPSDVSNLISITPGGTLIREQYAQFMETPDEQIAAELTRIDWSEFSQIRPRDLVRHVSTSPEQRDKCKSLQHVSRMISHFNHVAYWVSNIILERPKAKHRGRALEKFMEIAWILRHKNNYNALGAVIAGINSTCIHRLTQTREFVNSETQKKFMRLELLMTSHRSNFSYRLALENTSTERIPFIPLHRRDLVTTDEGNKTFLDGQKINWNKFQLMGDILMVIVESQRNPYRDLKPIPAVERMILDAVISTNEDELFDRSVHLEGIKGQKGSRSRTFWGKSPATNVTEFSSLRTF